MSNDNHIQSFLAHDEILYLAPGSPTHFEMDEAFCARMRAAIEAGLEKCADWYHHHARDQKSQIRPNKATGSLLSGLTFLNSLDPPATVVIKGVPARRRPVDTVGSFQDSCAVGNFA